MNNESITAIYGMDKRGERYRLATKEWKGEYDMQLQFLLFTITIEKRSEQDIVRAERHYRKASEQLQSQKNKYFYHC